MSNRSRNGRAGAEGGRTEKAVGKEPLSAGVPRGRRWCMYFRLFLRVHHRKIIRGRGGGRNRGEVTVASSILRTHLFDE